MASPIQVLLIEGSESDARLVVRELKRDGYEPRWERVDTTAALQAAILEALERDVPHPNAVRFALERQREQQGDAPPIAIVLPAHVRDRDAPVRPHALETYDQLKDPSDD